MPRLNDIERQLLLAIAREAVRTHLLEQPPEAFEVPSGPLDDPSGVFVSLHLGGQLRGCIGRLEAVEPVYMSTAECAVSAATRDPRFAPLALAELSRVSFELSVLSTPHPIGDIDEIEVGRHGLVVASGLHKGVLLPQVALEHEWDGEEFLRQTLLKAGLVPVIDGFDGSVFVFEAQVFAEESRI